MCVYVCIDLSIYLFYSIFYPSIYVSFYLCIYESLYLCTIHRQDIIEYVQPLQFWICIYLRSESIRVHLLGLLETSGAEEAPEEAWFFLPGGFDERQSFMCQFEGDREF